MKEQNLAHETTPSREAINAVAELTAKYGAEAIRIALKHVEDEEIRDARLSGIGTPAELSHITDVRMPMPPSAYLAPVGVSKSAK